MSYERNEQDVQSAHQCDSLAVESASQKWSVVKSASVLNLCLVITAATSVGRPVQRVEYYFLTAVPEP